MHLLICYASLEGQTAKIAETIAAQVRLRPAWDVTLRSVEEANGIALTDFDAVLLAAPIHIGRYPGPFVDFVHRQLDGLNSRPSAMVSVSLAIASEHADERSEAEGFVTQLSKLTGWQPTAVLHAAGALRYTQYDFFKRWMMRRIAAKEGASTDTSQDHELTDWTAVERFVAEFLGRAGD
jgi:menaquinone-dependent protoporphyrinogen oxidase